jgi:transposase
VRDVFNGLRYLVRYGVAWRALPDDLPLGPAVYEQAVRWRWAGCFEMLAQDLRAVLRRACGRAKTSARPCSAAARCARPPESGRRAGWDGHKSVRSSKLHLAVDTLGPLLALPITPANVDDRAAVAELAETVQEVTGGYPRPSVASCC